MMNINDFDLKKFERELFNTDEEMLQLKTLEERKADIKKYHEAILWAVALRDKVKAYTKADPPNPQTLRYYNYSVEFPELLLYKGVANSERFLARYESDKDIQRYAKEELAALKKSGWIERNRSLFNKLRKRQARVKNNPSVPSVTKHISPLQARTQGEV
ncbi:MAG: hypothetical protein WCY10_02975 [Candidatus Omnitrophota bacterium]